MLTFVEAAADKALGCTVALTAGRGRGKSAALGLSLAAAIAYGYANIFVTAPSPENLRTLFEFVLKGFDALEYKEHQDFTIVESTNPELKKAVVRINVFHGHRQTIQYIEPTDDALLAQAELLVVDEAAAIPLPTVRKLLGPHLTFLASTVNGYEGTGRALTHQLISQLRARSANGADAGASGDAADAGADGLSGRSLREVSLDEPIRYAAGDAVESWLHSLLCLDAAAALPTSVGGCPHPSECELYWVDRDALFSYHSASEAFLQRMIALFVASHYKNSPNDLQLMSDAPAHQLYVLLGPVDKHAAKLPEVLAAVQLSLEGDISREVVQRQLARGEAPSGDLIPWTISQQFQESSFASLSGARVVRVAVHPEMQHMGYGSRALDQLVHYFSGEMGRRVPSTRPRRRAAAVGGGLLSERLAPRPTPCCSRCRSAPRGARLAGASFGVTEPLFNFWHKAGFVPVYVRQTTNETTGENTAVMIRSLMTTTTRAGSVITPTTSAAASLPPLALPPLAPCGLALSFSAPRSAPRRPPPAPAPTAAAAPPPRPTAAR